MNVIPKKQMKAMNNGCCGSYSTQKVIKEKEPIPANPKISRGVPLIYVGSGKKSFKGKATDSVYYVSDHFRHFRVHPEDAVSILSNGGIIRKP